MAGRQALECLFARPDLDTVFGHIRGGQARQETHEVDGPRPEDAVGLGVSQVVQVNLPHMGEVVPEVLLESRIRFALAQVGLGEVPS